MKSIKGMGGKYVSAKVKCPREEDSQIWWLIARSDNWNMTREGEYLCIYGRHKTPEEVEDLRKIVNVYHEHEFECLDDE